MLCPRIDASIAPTAPAIPLLARLSALVEARLGLHFPPERWRELERGTLVAAGQLGLEGLEAICEWLAGHSPSRAAIEILASQLTVGETYFFRDEAAFAALESRVLPGLIAERERRERRLRLWSAGCCTGEEPYSIAIVLRRLLPVRPDWNATILATDLNPQFLRKAETGVYGEWSFRNLPSDFKAAYFTSRAPGQYQIRAEFQQAVEFAYLNLAEDVYPSLLNNTNAIDAIFCRNVLMYFAPARVPQMLEKLCAALVEGGWLFVSPAESALARHAPLVAVGAGATTLFRKDSVAARNGRQAMLPLMPTPEAPRVPATHPEASIAPPESMAPTSVATASPDSNQGPESEPVPMTCEPELVSDSQRLARQARVRANEGALSAAVEACDQAIALDRLNPALYYLRATILHELGALELAIASLRRALFLDQNFALAHFVLGNLTRRQHMHREAARHFANAHALLVTYPPETLVPEADGMTASRLLEIIRATASEAMPS